VIAIFWIVNLLHRHTIVKLVLFEIGEVAESIPLGAALRVEGPYIVVDTSRRLRVHVLVEDLTAEEGNVFLSIERPVEGDSETR
jgi:hypothetical protein